MVPGPRGLALLARVPSVPVRSEVKIRLETLKVQAWAADGDVDSIATCTRGTTNILTRPRSQGPRADLCRPEGKRR